MRLRELGEFGLIARIERLARASSGPDAGARAAGAGRPVRTAPAAPGRVVLGIGDDAALLRVRAGEEVALTTDAFVEGVHFRLGAEPPGRIGRRAVVANLSDLAAMGARPLGFTLALAAPPALAARAALGLVRGAAREGAAHGCPLVGGNVTRARETSLTIAALGVVRRGGALRRSAARPGDRVLVTGSLGGGALARARAARAGGAPRHRAQARLAAGAALARLRGIGACIDVSDGLAADFGHVLEASGVGGRIDVAAVPRPRGFEAACARLRIDPDALVLGGGEDYELLFTLRPGATSARALSRRLGLPVTEIGRIEAGRRLRLEGPRGRSARRAAGWRHF